MTIADFFDDGKKSQCIINNQLLISDPHFVADSGSGWFSLEVLADANRGS